MRKNYQILLTLLLMLCLATLGACGDDDEPADPSAADKVDKVYANLTADGILTQDLLYLADVKVKYSINGTTYDFSEITEPNFAINRRYEVQRPLDCTFRVEIVATPKQDFPQRVKTKEYWNLFDKDCGYDLALNVRTAEGKLVQSQSKHVPAEVMENVPADKVASCLLISSLCDKSFTYTWK